MLKIVQFTDKIHDFICKFTCQVNQFIMRRYLFHAKIWLQAFVRRSLCFFKVWRLRPPDIGLVNTANIGCITDLPLY